MYYKGYLLGKITISTKAPSPWREGQVTSLTKSFDKNIKILKEIKENIKIKNIRNNYYSVGPFPLEVNFIVHDHNSWTNVLYMNYAFLNFLNEFSSDLFPFDFYPYSSWLNRIL